MSSLNRAGEIPESNRTNEKSKCQNEIANFMNLDENIMRNKGHINNAKAAENIRIMQLNVKG